MMLSLSNSLSRTRYGILDADAGAYVAAVESALGSSITFTQRRAIDTFIKGEKAASRYTLIKRLYLPIWGQAAANAIDMITLTSGTFNGTVTHAAGYVQENGTTGYFNYGVTPSALSLTTSSGGLFGLFTQADSASGSESLFIASVDDIGANIDIAFGSSSSDNLRLDYNTFANTVDATLARAQQVGVLSAMRHSGNRTMRKRATAGVSSIYDTAGADFGTIPTTQTIYAMAMNYVGSAIGHSNARFGLHGVSLGMSTANTDAFTLALKTLWEQCSGLSLP